MITKHDEYWHLYYNAYGPDDPAWILARVEEMFADIAGMPETEWFVRVRPTIERMKDFDKGPVASVRCRFSAKAPETEQSAPEVAGFGL